MDIFEEFKPSIESLVRKALEQQLLELRNKNLLSKISEFTFFLELDKPTLDKFGLTTDISVSVRVSQTLAISYYYKGLLIEPVGTYLTGLESHLLLLHEAIRQGTEKPNMLNR